MISLTTDIDACHAILMCACACVCFDMMQRNSMLILSRNSDRDLATSAARMDAIYRTSRLHLLARAHHLCSHFLHAGPHPHSPLHRVAGSGNASTALRRRGGGRGGSALRAIYGARVRRRYDFARAVSCDTAEQMLRVKNIQIPIVTTVLFCSSVWLF